MPYEQSHLHRGMAVYGSDDAKIGDISEVGPNYVVVEKGWFFIWDIFIPVSAITQTRDDGVYLNIPKDQVKDMDWHQAPLEQASSTMTETATTSLPDRTQSAEYAVTNDVTTGTSQEVGDTLRVPIVEEEVHVGKRAIEGGGVRVTTQVTEVPVNEQVTLHEEHVDVERRPVDRPASEADLTPLQEGTLEVRDRREEAVIDKQARVVEEVVISKDVNERTETVQDTARRTDVQVEKIPGEQRTSTFTETAHGRAGDVMGTGGTVATTGAAASTTNKGEGAIERGLSKAENAAERATGLDLDRDRDVGQRDPRDNY